MWFRTCKILWSQNPDFIPTCKAFNLVIKFNFNTIKSLRLHSLTFRPAEIGDFHPFIILVSHFMESQFKRICLCQKLLQK